METKAQSFEDRLLSELGRLADSNAKLLSQAPEPAVPIWTKVFLRLDEAVAYSGLTRRELVEFVRDGKLKIFRSDHRRDDPNTWRISRRRLDALG